jgi:hypothetical protein
MIVITIDNFAFRQLNDGTMESATVSYSKERDAFLISNWEKRADRLLDMTGGETFIILGFLKNLNAVFANRVGLPVHKTEPKKVSVSTEPV